MDAVYLKDPELTNIFKVHITEEGDMVADGSNCDKGKLERRSFIHELEYREWVEENNLQEMEETQYDRLSQIYNYSEA